MTRKQSHPDRSTFDRRTLLKATAVTGIAATGVPVLSGTVAAQTTVSGGGQALQTAIDNASAGDTLVVVDSATYDPIVVDKALTLTSADGENPTIAGDGGISTGVSVQADDVTLDGFTVTNPDGLLGVKVERGYDDATIVNNTVDNVGPTGVRGVTGIIVGQGDHDGIDIRNNLIQDLDQETTSDSGFPTVNGILFDADNSNPGTVSDTVVNNNVIREVESDIAPLGIVTQHELVDVDINNNEIRNLFAADSTDSDQSDGVDFGFTFAQGINVASPSTTDTVVAGNVIEDLTSAETILPEAIKIDGDGGGVTFRANQFLVAIGLNNLNGTDGGSRDPSNDPVVDARNNYWGSPDGPEEAEFNQAADDDERSDVVGNVEYEPFLRNPPSG